MKKFVFAYLATLLLATHVLADEETASSLCGADEHQYFSCRVHKSAKIVSLCGNVDLSESGGSKLFDEQDSAYLQYRFGSPEKIEMIYPKTKQDSFAKFGGGNIRTYFGALQEVEFSIGEYRYNVSSSSFAQNDERTDVKEFYGVKVTKGNSITPKEFLCDTNPFHDARRKRDTWGDFNVITDQLQDHHQ